MDGERQMFQGNWTCSKCSKEITELPFEPRDTTNLMCRDCHKENRPARDNNRGERKMYEGDWKCADCGGSITQLPFEPRDTSNLKCRDCFSSNR